MRRGNTLVVCILQTATQKEKEKSAIGKLKKADFVRVEELTPCGRSVREFACYCHV